MVALLKFILPRMDTAYVELPLFAIYNLVAFIYFFNEQPRWMAMLKSLAMIVLFFVMVQYLEDLLIQVLY